MNSWRPSWTILISYSNLKETEIICEKYSVTQCLLDTANLDTTSIERMLVCGSIYAWQKLYLVVVVYIARHGLIITSQYYINRNNNKIQCGLHCVLLRIIKKSNFL